MIGSRAVDGEGTVSEKVRLRVRSSCGAERGGMRQPEGGGEARLPAPFDLRLHAGCGCLYIIVLSHAYDSMRSFIMVMLPWLNDLIIPSFHTYSFCVRV